MRRESEEIMDSVGNRDAPACIKKKYEEFTIRIMYPNIEINVYYLVIPKSASLTVREPFTRQFRQATSLSI